MTHATFTPMATQRADLMSRLEQGRQYDIVVVGGGATGLGVALDAAARGFSVVLVDSHDFAHGTSSRSTKLVHGGVRYLAQGNIALVQEALHERAIVLKNAPYVAQPLAFVMPTYRWWESSFFGAGLKMYDLLAGRAGLGRTEMLGRRETLSYLPTLRTKGLSGGVKYWDGQFNDARLALALARTAASRGALLVNYCRATELQYSQGKVSGVRCTDTLTGQSFTLASACVVNATGVWVDELRQQDGLAVPEPDGEPTEPLVAPSQGVHMVVDREFLGSDTALIVPKTADGRVLFAVPWLGKVILGTTDTHRKDLSREPLPFGHEIEFILNESARYLRMAPKRIDVKSVWVGLRPLVKPPQHAGHKTKSISREHTILSSPSGLVTVTGGKWTTYRAMAEDVLEKCEQSGLIRKTTKGLTESLSLVGAGDAARPVVSLALAPGWHSYGAEQDFVRSLPGADDEICAGLTQAMVRFAARYEYAMTVEDVLARRSRCLFLDARMAARVAEQVGAILMQETNTDPKTAEFIALAGQYVL
ncbi:MAG: glycerol-3-phosphate dehydrogenase/oxidase [Rhodoferax sp.]|jgi:glycerol-3-phosphate dehydrogenase|uniref:glycerol-3-phosphate dehydrogenase/oxidase n=1 Tax=Rhodoferax sp. TaxID=50421 RepID=UPI001B4260C3|nr:glycerol-3-phosphate dehydrogenase/oxidase [Rhodoferax sp.]MBP9736006.1 glycerol-3-phosphate dehydrogenase/oxidase [Rhodoferax sp.]